MPDILDSILSFYRGTDPALDPYRRASHSLRASIIHGTLRPGQQLPSTRELSEALGMNPMTASKALRDLAINGIITQPRGRAYIVSDEAVEKCTSLAVGDIRTSDLRFLHLKMKHFKIARTKVLGWLKEYDDADKASQPPEE